MLRSKIPEGKECNHPTCGSTCRREKKPRVFGTSIPRTSAKPIKKHKTVLAEEEEDKLRLKEFFDQMMKINDPECANCGAFAPEIKYPHHVWKSAQAHIFPKRHFKSIATNPLNILVMFPSYSGICDCHTQYDSSWLNASKMRVWPIVVDRFRLLYPLIAAEEHQYIPEILLKTL